MDWSIDDADTLNAALTKASQAGLVKYARESTHRSHPARRTRYVSKQPFSFTGRIANVRIRAEISVSCGSLRRVHSCFYLSLFVFGSAS